MSVQSWRSARLMPWVAACVCLCIGLGVGAGFAEVKPDSDRSKSAPTRLAHAGDPDAGPSVEVRAHSDNSIGSSDAASEGVINAEMLRSRPRSRPAEVLEFVPGMLVTQHSGEGKANQYYLRGFNLDHGTDFATSVAGVPINFPTHAHGQGYTDLNFLIPELIDRINYRKGPYFAESGDFSAAGGADFILRDRLAPSVSSSTGLGANPTASASLTLGSWDYRRALMMAAPQLSNGATLLGALELGTNNGPWQVPEDLRKTNAVVRYIDGPRSNGLALTLMAYSARWNSTDQIPERAVLSGQIGRFGTIDQTAGGRTERYSLSGQWRRRLDNGALSADAWFLHYALDLYSNFTYFLDRPTQGDQFEQRDRRNAFGGQVKRSWVGKFGGLAMTNEIGFQLRQDRIDVGLFDTVARQVTGTTRTDQVKETSMALFWENSLNWTPWFRSVLGARVDHFDFDVNSNLPQNSGTASAGMFSPKLALIFGPWSNTEWFFNAGRGFHSNDARGVLTRVDPTTGAPVTPVPALAAASGEEIGLRSQWLPGLQTSISLWRLLFASELVFSGDAGTTEPNRASRRWGVELSNRYVLNDWLLVDADLAWTRARFVDNEPIGNSIPGAVNRIASMALSVRDIGPWSGSIQLRYLGPRPLIEDNSVQAASSTTLNARLGYRIDPKIQLSLDVFNLTNARVNDTEYYYTSRLPNEPAAGVADRHFHPALPRSARITLSAGF
jgi:hypothetical protein